MPLSFLRRGHGDPLLLIHGLFGSGENLGGISRHLSKSFDTYSIDLPNHGKSEHTSKTSLSLVTQTVAQFLVNHGVDKVSVVGHSLGGKVAMELALTRPQVVNKLVVMDMSPVAYPPHHNRVFEGLMAINVDALQSRADADEILESYVPEYPIRSFLLKNLVKNTNGGFSWRVNLPVLHEGYGDLLRENANARFDGPTLLLKGGASDYLHESHRENIMRRFPNVSMKIVQNTGHWLHAEKPELVSRLISNFLHAE